MRLLLPPLFFAKSPKWGKKERGEKKKGDFSRPKSCSVCSFPFAIRKFACQFINQERGEREREREREERRVWPKLHELNKKLSLSTIFLPKKAQSANPV